MRIAHISDLHFGHHDPAVAAGLAADLKSQAPDLVVASGDFTQRGTASEFEMARSFLASLAAPVFAVPGNHDLGRNLVRRFLDPYGMYRRYIAPDIEPFLETDGVALAGLNTTRRALSDRDWSNGSINPASVTSSTPPSAAPRPGAPHRRRSSPADEAAAADAEADARGRRSALALEAFAALGVRLVLSGHFHLSFVRRYERRAVAEGIPSGPREAAAAPILVCQASSVISDRLRGEPNAYNLIDIANGVIDVHVREWHEGKWETREEAEVAA